MSRASVDSAAAAHDSTIVASRGARKLTLRGAHRTANNDATPPLTPLLKTPAGACGSRSSPSQLRCRRWGAASSGPQRPGLSRVRRVPDASCDITAGGPAAPSTHAGSRGTPARGAVSGQIRSNTAAHIPPTARTTVGRGPITGRLPNAHPAAEHLGEEKAVHLPGGPCVRDGRRQLRFFARTGSAVFARVR